MSVSRTSMRLATAALVAAIGLGPTSTLGAGTFPALDGDAKFVLAPMKGQILTVLNGHPGTAMAAWRDQLNDVEIASVITYTRNAWSNAGKGPDPVVQPSNVTALR